MDALEQCLAALAVLLLFVGAPLLVGMVGRVGRGQRRRRAWAFAQSLAQSLGDTHIAHYAEQLGYAALVGDAHLTHAQRALLLSAPDAADLIARYLRVRTLLVPSCKERRFLWRRARHAHRAYRFVATVAWLVCCLGSGMLAFLPVVTWTQVHGTGTMPGGVALAQTGFCLALLWTALWSLRLGQRLGRAETLVAAAGIGVRAGSLEALYPLDRACPNPYPDQAAAND